MKKLKIISKKYQRNLQYEENTVYFKIEDKNYEVNIVYIPKLNKNAFLIDRKYGMFEDILRQEYMLNSNEIEEFRSYFLYKLSLYSHHSVSQPYNVRYPSWIM